MADSGKVRTAETRANAGDAGTTPGSDKRLRMPLRTAEEVRAEMARLYRDWKAGRRNSAEVSRMLNGLSLIGRQIEQTEYEVRLRALEQAREVGDPRP